MRAHNTLLNVALERDGFHAGRKILALAGAVTTIGVLVGIAIFGN
ncbi:hypothetical protein [Caballeronia sp. SEWSISQ10-4 2]|nr:hypothetical protein [Caballeronia sp. SEWSISQ10-4 2]